MGADRETLQAALLDHEAWLSVFQRKTYPDAFRDYQARFAPAWRAAAGEAGERGAMESLAAELLDALEGERKDRPFWARGALAVDQRQMAALYFSPMLLALETEEGRAFCLLLRDAWNARWPKETYGVTTAEHIQKGFKATFMGIPLDRPKEGGKRDWL